MQKRMNKLKETLLGQHEVRKTDAQKTAFIRWAEEYAKACGCEMQTEESGKLIRTRNLIFGDLKTARTLITAHYDTCARMPFPNFMTPNCWPVIILTQLLLPVIFFLALGVISGYASAKLLPLLMPVWAAEIAAPLLCAAISFAIVGLMLFGPQNPHTANDNTSGVAAVLALLSEYAGRNDVALVLFDNEEKGLLGSSAFVKAHQQLHRQAFVINLDCVSDGDTLLFAYAKRAKDDPRAARIIAALEEAAPRYGKTAMAGQSPKVLYPSDQMVFARGTAFAALKGKRILYLDRIHTAKDTVFDDRNLLCLCEVIGKAI
ncbi:MAG: M28 family peptidase [Clostridia bacterium]|nr:M28 family peptidase [Clostridia bacterium]